MGRSADDIDPLPVGAVSVDRALSIRAVEVADTALARQPDAALMAVDGAAPSHMQPVPMSTAGVPVADLVRELHAQALSGDPAATCRLTAELLRCRMLRHLRPVELDSMIDSLAAGSLTDEQIKERTDRFVQFEDYKETARAGCQGIGVEDLRNVPRYLLASAQHGHLPSMIRFADGVGIGGEDMVADPQLYSLYREHARSMFMRAFEAGHPQAAHIWHNAITSGGFRFLAGVLPPEWHTPEVAEALTQMLRGGGSELPPGTAIPPDASRQAQALFERWFANSRWRSSRERLPPPPPADLQQKHEHGIRACVDGGPAG